MRPRKGPKKSKPDRTPAQELLHRMEMAASAEGKLLGEWLYYALAEPFDFTGVWDRPNKADLRKKYQRAAQAFARQLAEALVETDPAS